LARQRGADFPATSLRLFSVYGPRERPDKLYPRLIESALTGKAFPMYEGAEHHSRSYTYVDDIVAGCVSVLDQPEVCIGEVFNLGSDREERTATGIRLVEEIVGQSVRIEQQPARAGDQIRTCANIDKARRLLGYAPAVSLEAGLRETVAWARSGGARKAQDAR
jgi:nucleoside-diphosphate-sugar epimerase